MLSNFLGVSVLVLAFCFGLYALSNVFSGYVQNKNHFRNAGGNLVIGSVVALIACPIVVWHSALTTGMLWTACKDFCQVGFYLVAGATVIYLIYNYVRNGILRRV